MSANNKYTRRELFLICETMVRAAKGIRGLSMQAAAMFLSRQMPHSAGSIYTTYMKVKQEEYANTRGSTT
jgi:hypothetical protein